MIYGVYENKAQVHWPPSKIFGDEITVCLSYLLVLLLPLTPSLETPQILVILVTFGLFSFASPVVRVLKAVKQSSTIPL